MAINFKKIIYCDTFQGQNTTQQIKTKLTLHRIHG